MCFVNCSDDDTPDDPADTITLNMLNEHNGKTYLGESNVYINEANNFITSKNFISDVGNGAGVGANILPSLTNLTHEVAVTPGHIYQIFNKKYTDRFSVRQLRYSSRNKLLSSLCCI